MDASPTASFGGVAALTCEWINETSMDCTTPPGIGAGHVVDMTVAAPVLGTHSNLNPFWDTSQTAPQTSASLIEFAYNGE